MRQNLGRVMNKTSCTVPVAAGALALTALLSGALAPLERFATAFRRRVATASRLLFWAISVSAIVAAAHLGRLGTLPFRLTAAALLLLTLGLYVAVRLRDRRDFRDPKRVIGRLLVPTQRDLGERALRAASLVDRTAGDTSFGSAELAKLHYERLLARASVEAVERYGAGRAGRFRVLTVGLLVLAGIFTLAEPARVIEGLNVLAARKGRAPLAMTWLGLVRVTVHPPAYLRGAERVLFSGMSSDQPKGSVITVRGVVEREGRRLVLTDGEREVPFVSDAAGGVVARWTLEKSGKLAVAARFGDVLVFEEEVIELEATADEAPRVDLAGAPQTVELRNTPRIELRYIATDDHGLRQIDLVLRSGSREERRMLVRLPGDSLIESGGHALDARDPFLRRMFLPVVVTIEARDNDALGGAKWGKSEPMTLVPPGPGDAEAERHAAIEAARDALVDALAAELALGAARELSPEDAKQRAEQVNAQVRAAVTRVQSAAETSFAGLRMPSPLKTFLLGQVRILDRPAATRTTAARRLEDVTLGVDAALRALAQHDAAEVSKRLGDVAEEAAVAAKEAFETERRRQGVERLDAALGVLDRGALRLLGLGTLGADLGSVTQGELRRARRAAAGGSYRETELVLQHLAARLRHAAPSFSSAGGGGVEAGGQGKSESSVEPSQAHEQFSELLRELKRLADEHSGEISGVERELEQARQSASPDELRQEAKERAAALRRKLGELPPIGAQPGSARAAAALAREHASAMAEGLDRLALKDAVQSGRNAKGLLSEAQRKARAPNSHEDLLDTQSLDEVGAELEKHLAWAEQIRERAEQQASDRARGALQRSSERERGYADRASNLAGRSSHGETTLPEDLSQSLERAEGLMREAAQELAAGRGEQALALQQQAQRLLEQPNDRDQTEESQQGESDRQSSNDSPDGKGMRQDTGVPDAKDSRSAEDFRRRVLQGLGKDKGGRLSPAVRRYAEGLLR